MISYSRKDNTELKVENTSLLDTYLGFSQHLQKLLTKFKKVIKKFCNTGNNKFQLKSDSSKRSFVNGNRMHILIA